MCRFQKISKNHSKSIHAKFPAFSFSLLLPSTVGTGWCTIQPRLTLLLKSWTLKGPVPRGTCTASVWTSDTRRRNCFRFWSNVFPKRRFIAARSSMLIYTRIHGSGFCISLSSLLLHRAADPLVNSYNWIRAVLLAVIAPLYAHHDEIPDYETRNVCSMIARNHSFLGLQFVSVLFRSFINGWKRMVYWECSVDWLQSLFALDWPVFFRKVVLMLFVLYWFIYLFEGGNQLWSVASCENNWFDWILYKRT